MSPSENPIVNDTELRIVGMSRSGNHAIINWLMRQAGGRLCFLNCAEPGTNPFVSARPLAHGLPYMANYADFDIHGERRGAFSRKDYLLHSYEDCFLGMLAKPINSECHDAWVGASRRQINVLILRDPFNLFASRRKSGFGEVNDQTARRIWKQHAREYLGMRRYLPAPLVCINYNTWISECGYRADLARRLGLTYDDAAIAAAPDFAPASAFAASDARQWLRRWQHYEHDADYRRLFDSTMVALAGHAFDCDQELQRRLL
ncbi:MAG TPA: hypothetical protein VK110_00425 [Salinisphaeraceae bacterium]|nr:hypothetical protein [Salinisphaeraceae bacterium]